LPPLKSETIQGKVDELRREHDGIRTGLVCEPRGHSAVVGAYLLPPSMEVFDHGVIFFNTADYLGMCGHGTIGLVRTLQHLGKLEPGEVKIETPAGPVRAKLHESGSVTVWNVKSYRYLQDVKVETQDFGSFSGDVAYGGNWFFLCDDHSLDLSFSNLDQLTRITTAIRHQLRADGVTGEHGEEIDHVEFFGAPSRDDADSRNFVLCPGYAYDRSPCGTGLSAKLACLAADGKLKEGGVWRQESFVGSLFEGSFEDTDGGVIPAITGKAWITGESTLIFEDEDPFEEGIAP
jgi:4-hydroxyproline epimerase